MRTAFRATVLLVMLLGMSLVGRAAVAAPTLPVVSRAAAVCAEYPNQAAAQRAANTRDSDGDGLYCEDLPCPCAGPGSTSAPTPQRKPAVVRARCRLGRLPDHACSPGRAATTNVARICTPGYSGRVRNVSAAAKERVYRAYGVRRHPRGEWEMDHLVPLELGGSNATKNLFPEAASPEPGFRQKDRLENELHRRVCDGSLNLRVAQRAIARNWLKAYKRYVLG